MREIKKGTKGIAANYITRTKAVRKLQISLKDFRRLCILKGIFPRDPKKKNNGKDKTYYHVKDIQFLSHEPLLQKFRDLKVFLRKHRNARVKRDKSRMGQLEANRPVLKLDHLVKERYPTFVDALRDVDDALNMLYLFAALPAKIIAALRVDRTLMCTRLCREWDNYIFRAKALSKVFVSIKGIYYQAEIQGQTVTWLVPHKFTQVIPRDVDYKVMLTFLDFYQTLIRFTNFKLYHDQGLHYPPKVDELKEAQLAGLQILQLQTLKQAKENGSGSSAPSIELNPKKIDPKTQALEEGVKAVLGKLSEQVPMNQDEEAEPEEEEQTDEFAEMADNSAKSPAQIAFERGRTLFAGLTFFLSREVPQDALEFVLLSGGAKVLRETALLTEHDEAVKNAALTHHVVDRPLNAARRRVVGRQYIQPQWVFDSFNAKVLLPSEPYAPGVVPPPHLSPFVNDEAVGYVPKQREVLKSWGALNPFAATQDEMAEKKEKASSSDEKEKGAAAPAEVDLEAQYEADLAKEAAGVSYSANDESKEQKSNDSDDDDEEDVLDDDEGEGDDVQDSDDDDEEDSGEEKEAAEDDEDEEEEEEEKEAAPAPSAGKRKRDEPSVDDPRELAKIMMSKKHARLYSRIQYGKEKRNEENENLAQKRARLEEEAAKVAKSQAKAKTTSKKGTKAQKSKK